MASLQVRDLPDQLYEKLKKEAAQKHRSLAQQAIVSLAKGLDTPSYPKERRLQLLNLLTKVKNIKKDYKLTDPLTLIREDRDR